MGDEQAVGTGEDKPPESLFKRTLRRLHKGRTPVPAEPFFPTTVAMPDPANETLHEYLVRSAAQGHYCCWCPQQTPPRPCCNEGHAQAVARLRALEAMEDGPDAG